MVSKKHRTAGFTLVEMLIAASIFTLAMVVITTAGANLYQNHKRQVARDTLYQESRALMDRLVTEVRDNTVDFDEYFNHLATDLGGGGSLGDYGDYYRGYLHQFFYVSPPPSGSAPCPELGLNDPARYAYAAADPCRAQQVNEGYFSTRADANNANNDPVISALGGVNLQNELYLLSGNGQHKTIIKRLPEISDIAQIAMLQLDLKDQYLNSSIDSGTLQEGNDGYYDCWANGTDFPNREFIPISPPTITVTELKFFVSPLDDPHKAFNESDSNVQAQPSVTIVLTTKVAAAQAKRFHGEDNPPELTLETTVSSRIYDNVEIPFAVTGPNPPGNCVRSLPVPSGGGGGSPPPPASPICGNGTRESGEECDGSDLAGQNCTNISGGFTGGGLSCNAGCTLNTSACVNGCVPSGKSCIICHIVGGCNTISPSNNARKAHLDHGDYDGACLSEDDSLTPLCGR